MQHLIQHCSSAWLQSFWLLPPCKQTHKKPIYTQIKTESKFTHVRVDFLSWHSKKWLGGLQAPILMQFLLAGNENVQGGWGLLVCPGSKSHLTTAGTCNIQCPRFTETPKSFCTSLLTNRTSKTAVVGLQWAHYKSSVCPTTTHCYPGGDQGLESLLKLLLSDLFSWTPMTVNQCP